MITEEIEFSSLLQGHVFPRGEISIVQIAASIRVMISLHPGTFVAQIVDD